MEAPNGNNFLSIFYPRGLYYQFLDHLYNIILPEINKDKVKDEELATLFNLKITSKYGNNVASAFKRFRRSRNIITHTNNIITIDHLNGFISACKSLKILKKDNVNIGFLDNMITTTAEYRKAYIPKITEAPPNIETGKFFKDNFKYIIKRKRIKILEGQFEGLEGMFRGWNGTSFYFIESNTREEKICSNRNKIEVYW